MMEGEEKNDEASSSASSFPESSSSNISFKNATINSFMIHRDLKATFLKKCLLKIRRLKKDEKIDAQISRIDLPIQYVEKLLHRAKAYVQNPLHENECFDPASRIIFSNNPFISGDYEYFFVVLQEVQISPKPYPEPRDPESHVYFLPSHALPHLSEYCPYGAEISAQFDPFCYTVFKNRSITLSDSDSIAQQAARIMDSCRKNELFYQYTDSIFLKNHQLSHFDCGLTVYEGFEMKTTKTKNPKFEEFIFYQICPIRKVFFTPLLFGEAIQKCFEHPLIREAFSHHCVAFFTESNTPFIIDKITFFDEKCIWNASEDLYKIGIKQKHQNDEDGKSIIGPKNLKENYSDELKIIPFQECLEVFWSSEIKDYVRKRTLNSPKYTQQYISSIVKKLNFLNKHDIKSQWHTQEIPILPMPSILLRNTKITPSIDGKFYYEMFQPLICGSKLSWNVVFISDDFLPTVKQLLIPISTTYRNSNILFRRLKKASEIHSLIIKSNSVDEIFIVIDDGGFSGFEELVTFAKTKNPEVTVIILKLKVLKNIANNNSKVIEMFRRILNVKVNGINHQVLHDSFLGSNISPLQVMFLSHYFLPAKFPNKISTAGFTIAYPLMKRQPVGQISFHAIPFQYRYFMYKFCESKIKQIQHGFFPRIVFIAGMDDEERDDISAFNGTMMLNLIQKLFPENPCLIYLSFTREHTFRAFHGKDNLQIGACIDDPTNENSFYLITDNKFHDSCQPFLKVRILLNQPSLPKSAIKHYIFSQCFENQLSHQSDSFPSTMEYSIKLAKKGVKVLEVLKKKNPLLFTGTPVAEARFYNKAIATQNFKYQDMDEDVENDQSRSAKRRKFSR